jgi:hypothetical protein
MGRNRETSLWRFAWVRDLGLNFWQMPTKIEAQPRMVRSFLICIGCKLYFSRIFHLPRHANKSNGVTPRITGISTHPEHPVSQTPKACFTSYSSPLNLKSHSPSIVRGVVCWLFACIDCDLNGGETAENSIELIDFFREF